MTFKFTSQKLLNGLFEPEGIYLAPPAEGELIALQGFGENADYYKQWNYNGVPLKGHVGIDLRVKAGTTLLAVDSGRVMEISNERGGFERYIKIEHRWGESFYANCGDVLVEAGQSVTRGEAVARALTAASLIPSSRTAAASESGQNRAPRRITSTSTSDADAIWFHFGVRIAPFNRYDGWGGFADPLPYLPTGAIQMPEGSADLAGNLRSTFTPHPMAEDAPGLRRP
jgi:hypothetical protein